VVLDASTAVQIALNRRPMADHLEAIAEADAVLAPELIVPEVTNAIWKYHQFEKLETETCQRVLELALNLVDTLVSGKDLYREAFLLARTSRLPAYDMFYLALARRDDATLLTVDRVLRQEAARQGVRVI
jgi:predicted nucleic acid-binding protein